ncbi:MAG: hypothetical protein IKN11_02710 [Bacteroidales bacterium]|nr:hypothetical protein [Bacteroidales bacterium]
MLKAFRTNIILQIVVILAVALLMWAKSFSHPIAAPVEGGGGLFYWITGRMSPITATIIGFVLVLFEGVLFNSILYRHKLITQSSLLPTLFYIIAMSIGHPTLTPMLMGSLFLLLAIEQLLLTTTLLSIGIDKTFGAAASVGMAIVLCPTMVVFLIPLLFSMFNYSLYSWRDWTMLILGLLAPFVVLETYYFLCDELFYRNYLLLYNVTDLHFVAWGNVVQWIISIIFLLLLIAGMVTIIGNSQSRNINFNKNTTTLLLSVLGSIAISLYSELFPIPTQAYAIPFSACATFLFIEPSRKEFVPNVIFIALLLIFVVSNWL